MKKHLNFIKISVLIIPLVFMLTACSSSGSVKTISVVSSAKEKLASFLQYNNDSTLEIPEAAGDSYFENSVFVGDSVTLSLKNYVTNQRNSGAKCLADASFLCSGSMSYYNSGLAIGEADAVHPMLDGETVLIEDGINTLGADKAFIMLGMNDFCLYSFEEDINNAETLINRIIEKNPDIKIYVQSVTPIIASKEHGSFTNENIDEFNTYLEKMCEENDWTYIDVNQLFKDDSNCLKDEYCSDPDDQGIHLKQDACAKWVEYLRSLF